MLRFSSRWFIASALTAFAAFPAFVDPLFADLVYFRNSKYTKGKVISRTPDVLYFRTEDGLQIEIPVPMIRKVIRIDEKEEQRLAQVARRETERKAKEAERSRAAREVQARIRDADARAERKVALARERARMAELGRRVDKLVAQKLQRAWQLRSGAVKRSAVLPGWGQHYMQRPGAGWTFNIAMALSTLYTLGAYGDLRRAERDFSQVGPPLALASLPGPDGITPEPAGPLLSSAYLDQKEAAADHALRKVNAGLLLMLITWGWNLYDVLNAQGFDLAGGDSRARNWRLALDLVTRRSSDSGPGREHRFSLRTGVRF